MPDLPEPPDRTGLYWPETAEFFAALVVRDDQGAVAYGAAIAADAEPEARWWAPNLEAAPMTWAEVLAETGGDDNRPISAAIWFTVPEATP